MNPLQEGLIKYRDLNLQPGYANYGGQFILPGTTPVYPLSTVYRTGRPTKKTVKNMEGGIDFKDAVNKTGNVIKKGATKAKPYAIELAKSAITPGIDLGFDLASKAIAVPLEETLGPVAPIATKLALKPVRKYVKKKTGYGKPRKGNVEHNSDVGIYDGGAHVNVDIVKMLSQIFGEINLNSTLTAIKNAIKAPLLEFLRNHFEKVSIVGIPTVGKLLSEYFKSDKIGKAFVSIARQYMKSTFGGAKKKRTVKVSKKATTHSSGIDKRKKRAELVKKIMKEKGMNLPQASKYIKENSLI